MSAAAKGRWRECWRPLFFLREKLTEKGYLFSLQQNCSLLKNRLLHLCEALRLCFFDQLQHLTDKLFASCHVLPFTLTAELTWLGRQALLHFHLPSLMPVLPLFWLIDGKDSFSGWNIGIDQMGQLLPNKLLHAVLAVNMCHTVAKNNGDRLADALLESWEDSLGLGEVDVIFLALVVGCRAGL